MRYIQWKRVHINRAKIRGVKLNSKNLRKLEGCFVQFMQRNYPETSIIKVLLDINYGEALEQEVKSLFQDPPRRHIFDSLRKENIWNTPTILSLEDLGVKIYGLEKK